MIDLFKIRYLAWNFFPLDLSVFFFDVSDYELDGIFDGFIFCGVVGFEIWNFREFAGIVMENWLYLKIELSEFGSKTRFENDIRFWWDV